MTRTATMLLKLFSLIGGRYLLRPDVALAATPNCRCCGSSRLESRGRLPDARIFAGAILGRALAGGRLYACNDCGFVFRYPIFSKEAYDELYRSGNATTWDEENRVDQELVRSALRRLLKSGSVLDIGCGSGNLLMPLEDGFVKCGIEINSGAAQIAQSRGIAIIAQDLEQAATLPRLFDAVVACDVIEHVADPLEFMRTLLSKAENGGLVIISTANADAWSWRLVGSRFWYCYLPEHISFVSPAWFENYADTLQARIVEVKEFVYSAGFSIFGKALRLALMGLFKLSPWLYYSLLTRNRRNNIPVGRGITRDHFVIVLRKQAA